MSIKINLVHCMKWTRLMLTVVFKEFELLYFFAIFFYSLSLSISKRSPLIIVFCDIFMRIDFFMTFWWSCIYNTKIMSSFYPYYFQDWDSFIYKVTISEFEKLYVSYKFTLTKSSNASRDLKCHFEQRSCKVL